MLSISQQVVVPTDSSRKLAFEHLTDSSKECGPPRTAAIIDFDFEDWVQEGARAKHTPVKTEGTTWSWLGWVTHMTDKVHQRTCSALKRCHRRPWSLGSEKEPVLDTHSPGHEVSLRSSKLRPKAQNCFLFTQGESLRWYIYVHVHECVWICVLEVVSVHFKPETLTGIWLVCGAPCPSKYWCQ